jgi:hypothetical protein
MSKRFTETEIWNEDWYLDMPLEYRHFWTYLKDTCNHAGIWKPNIRRFNADLENKVDVNVALTYFNGDKLRIDVLPSGHWVILDFVKFQYGSVLNLNNSCHLSVFNRLNDLGVSLGSLRGQVEVKEGSKRPLRGVSVGVKEKEKEKDLISNISSNGNIVLDSSNINNYEEILKVVDSFYTIMVNQFPKKYKEFEKKKDAMYSDGVEIVDKLIRLDGYSIDDVTLALKFWIHDDFYSGSMHSLGGLRKKSDNGSTKFENLFHKCISQDKKTNMETFINA